MLPTTVQVWEEADSFSTDDEHQLSATTTSNVDWSPPASTSATTEFQTVPEGPTPLQSPSSSATEFQTVPERPTPLKSPSSSTTEFQTVPEGPVLLQSPSSSANEFQTVPEGPTLLQSPSSSATEFQTVQEGPTLRQRPPSPGVEFKTVLRGPTRLQGLSCGAAEFQTVPEGQTLLPEAPLLQSHSSPGSESLQPEIHQTIIEVDEALWTVTLQDEEKNHVHEFEVRRLSAEESGCLVNGRKSSSSPDKHEARKWSIGHSGVHNVPECLATNVLSGQTVGLADNYEAETRCVDSGHERSVVSGKPVAMRPSIGHSVAECLDKDSISTDDQSPSSSRSRDRTSSSCSSGDRQVRGDDVIVVMETEDNNCVDLVGTFFTPSIADSFAVDAALPPLLPPPREKDQQQVKRCGKHAFYILTFLTVF